LDNNHSHDAVAAFSALPQCRIAAMTPEEKQKSSRCVQETTVLVRYSSRSGTQT
jgi:excinuclease UvrABC nuclease subunit